MGSSVFLRMMTGLSVMLVLARTLGPEQFGFVSTIVAFSYFAGLLTDFGFSLKSLRDIAAAPSAGHQILAFTLRMKFVLTLGAAILGAAALLMTGLSTAEKLAGAAFGSGVLIGAFGDLALVSFRATTRYSGEACIVSATSAVHIVLVIPAALSHQPVWLIGSAFLVSRGLYALVSVLAALQLFPPANAAPLGSAVSRNWAAITRAIPWAIDNGLTYLNSQVDALLIVPVLGLAAAGVYQSGARLVQAALATSAVLSSIHIPSVAARGGEARLSRSELLMLFEFLSLGLFWAIIFAVGGPLATKYLLGDAYIQLDQLWPGFAVFVLIRYLAGSFGSAIAALAKPAFRIAAQIAGLAVILYGFADIAPKDGLAAVPWIMASGSAVTLVVFVGARVTLLTSSKEPNTAASN